MIKVKEFLVRYQLVDFVNDSTFTGKVISITTKDNTAMSSPCLRALNVIISGASAMKEIKINIHGINKKCILPFVQNADLSQSNKSNA